MTNIKLVAENKIENLTFELYTNGNNKSYQLLQINSNGSTKKTNMVAPVDFFDVLNAVLYSKDLNEFLDFVKKAWCGEIIENMINELVDLENGAL